MTRYTIFSAGVLVLILASAGLLPACGKAPDLAAVHVPLPVLAPEETPEPLEIPLDASLRAEGRIKVTEEGLHFAPERLGGGLSLTFDPPLNAARYNVFEVHMKLPKGGQCSLSWGGSLSPLDPKGKKNPRAMASVFPGEEFQKYTITLGNDDNAAWAGEIDRIYFVPVDVRSEAVLASMRFLYEAPARPMRMTLGEVTMEAYCGTQAPWRLRVPPRGVFETHLGMHGQSWQHQPWGTARFVLSLETPKGARFPLLDRKISPGQNPRDRAWTPVRIPLHEYAGKEVTLHLEIDPCTIPFGDYAFWGNPVVFSEAPDPSAVPIVLISCDTLRADRLSCYGYFRETSPNLDRWAQDEAVIFLNAITPETYTLPSHMSMLTGLFPNRHKVTPYTNLAESEITLPQWLRQQGYISAGFASHNWWLKPWRGFAQGFDLYNVSDNSFRHIYDTGSLVAQWLDEHRTARRFLFFHNYDLHSKLNDHNEPKYRLPYDPGDDEFRVFSHEFNTSTAFKNTEKNQFQGHALITAYNDEVISFTDDEHALLNALYDDCVRMVDNEIGELFSRLRRQGLYDNALIIVTADHGEGLNERNYYGHNTVFDEECRVPLIIRFPKGEAAGTRYEGQVQLVDLFATVQHVLGATDDLETDGQSLLAMIRGELGPRQKAYIQRGRYSAVRENVRKLVSERKAPEHLWRYYDLGLDPGETNDIATANPIAWEDLRKEHDTFFETQSEGWFLRFNDPSRQWTGQIQVFSDDPMVPYFTDGDGLRSPIKTEEENKFQFDVNCAKGSVTVRIYTASARSRIHVLFTSPRSFQTHIDDKTTPPKQTFEMLLDPEARLWPSEPPVNMPDRPAMALWYRPPDAHRGAAQQPDEETKEQLEALGYLE